MLQILSSIALVLLIMAGTWWLSGYDTRLSGDDTRSDYFRRGFRCGLTWLLLVILLLLPAEEAMVPVVVFFGGLLAITWGWCLGEFFSHGLHILTGALGSDRDYDPHEHIRNLDQLATLLREGKRDEALQLAEALKTTGDANVLAVETLLERAGIPQERSQKLTPLAEARRFHAEGKFNEAEAILKSLLAENPSNVDAALMLMRVYVQDFHQNDKAMEVLRKLEKQPHISRNHVEYASRSIHDWGRKKVAPQAEAVPETIEGLIAAGYLGTAIEILERSSKEQPDDFETQLKLAETYGLNSADIKRAEKIVGKIEKNPAFTPEQARLAKAKLAEWCQRDQLAR